MENKRLLQENDNFENIKENLNTVKKEVSFSKLLSEYKKIKKTLWKLNDSNASPEDIKEKEKEKSLILTKFKKVDLIETKLFSVRKRIVSIISSLDNIKNNLDYVVKILEAKNTGFLKIISKEYKKEIEIEIEKNESEIISLNNEIKEFKENKKPAIFLSFKISQIKQKNGQLRSNLNKKINEESIKEKIEKNENKINNKKEKSSLLQGEIDYAVDLMKRIDDELQFKDSDDINRSSSFSVKHLNAFYGNKQALFDINVEFPKNQVIAIIGPSGCGKSTFLRTLNRINDNIETFKAKGKILLDGEYDIFKLRSIINRYDKLELSTLRTKVGMIFQQPNPFPMSIIKNVQYGPKVKGIKNKSKLNELTENSLKESGLWNEVKDNLRVLGTSLSGGQQQRLCIARAIANEPEILLMDEPTSALDPIAAKKIENLILKLKENYTVIMVTHSMQQAQRISDKTAFFYQGKLVEYGTTKQIFEKPKEKETKDYVSGEFG